MRSPLNNESAFHRMAARAEKAEAELAKFKELAHESLGVVLVEMPPSCDCEYEDEGYKCGNCEASGYIAKAKRLLGDER